MSDSGLTLPTRTEDRARIEAALKVAREGLRASRSLSADLRSTSARAALIEIVLLLDGGDTQPQQGETGTAQAKPDQNIAVSQATGRTE